MDHDFASTLNEIIAGAPPDARERYERDVALVVNSGLTTQDALLAAVEDPSLRTEVQQTACWILGQLVGGQQALEVMLRALANQKREVSFEAAKSLVSWRIEESFPRIVSIMLRGENPHNRAAAAYSLGMLTDKNAVDDLVNVLSRDDASEVRSHAAEALGHISDKRATDSLIKSLEDDSVEVRFWAAFALGEIGEPKAIPKLERLAESDGAILSHWGSVSLEAQKAIDRIRTLSRPLSNEV